MIWKYILQYSLHFDFETLIRSCLKTANRLVFLLLFVRLIYNYLHGTSSTVSLWKSLTVVVCVLCGNYFAWPACVKITNLLMLNNSHMVLAVLLMTIDWCWTRWWLNQRSEDPSPISNVTTSPLSPSPIPLPPPPPRPPAFVTLHSSIAATAAAPPPPPPAFVPIYSSVAAAAEATPPLPPPQPAFPTLDSSIAAAVPLPPPPAFFTLDSSIAAAAPPPPPPAFDTLDSSIAAEGDVPEMMNKNISNASELVDVTNDVLSATTDVKNKQELENEITKRSKRSDVKEQETQEDPPVKSTKKLKLITRSGRVYNRP